MAAAVDSDAIGPRCIEEFDVDSLNNPTYLPQSEFSDFLQRNRVEETVRGNRHFGSYSLDKVQRLIDYSTRNPKVFLTLAVSDLICKMPLLFSDNFRDFDLPIRRKRDSNGFQVYSMADRHDERPWRCFIGNGWSWCRMDIFLSNQWLFCAVIFEKNRFKYEVPQKCPLPYTKLEDAAAAGGHFGRVFKLQLREEHITSSFENYLPYHRKVRQIPFRTTILIPKKN